ncbi:MAG: hypothetical protein WD002_04730 [Pseudomonadales bacterium]
MLLVKPPDKSQLLSILDGLLGETCSREEVVTWWQATESHFGTVNLLVEEGFWYYQSLSALTIPISLGDGEPYFVRDCDIAEYLLDLQGVGSGNSYEGITRVRAHQVGQERTRWPLLMFEHTEINRLAQIGLTPVRGIFDAHMDLVEHTHLFFEGELYLIVRQYDDQASQLMILGTSRDETRLKDFLTILGYA